jgi:hypothetical protein
MSSVDLIFSTLLSPIILFFALGLFAALLRSQMSIPQAFSKGLAIYLMMAIGLKGGYALSETPLTLDLGFIFLIGLILSFGLPFLAYAYLRLFTKLSSIDAAATAGHYGSISIVTFVAGTQVLTQSGYTVSGYMVAVAAIMEVPAIISALFLARKHLSIGNVAGAERGELTREILLNASIVVLIGSLIIGWIGGADGHARVKAFFVDPFDGVLCLFLLDMGLNAGRGLRRGWRALDLGALSFGICVPIISAGIAVLLCQPLGLTTPDLVLMMILAASASYIAVPAAMRLALPKANPSIYLTLSLGVTFPFNLTLGIPLYLTVATLVTG